MNRPHAVFALNHFAFIHIGHIAEARFELILFVWVVALWNHQIEDGMSMADLFDLTILLFENFHCILAHKQEVHFRYFEYFLERA